jgi:NADH dehydrogenase FAD-containing subunit
MVPNWVAGHSSLEDCSIAIEPLARRAGVRWLQRSVGSVDVENNTVYLDDDHAVRFDLLSVSTGPLHNRAAIEQALPGARQHALFALPSESLGVLWPQVLEISRQRALRVAVLGDSAHAVALAMAVRFAVPNASVTLVAGHRSAGHYAPAPMQQRIVRALKKRQITVLQDTAVSLDSSAVMLGCGAALACDVPLYAGAAQAAPWVGLSGLTTDAQGFIAVDGRGRSLSHTQLWSTDSTHAFELDDRALGAKLATNLLAVVAGRSPQPLPHTQRSLQTQACGQRYAIGAWGTLTFEGHWVWQLQRYINRQALAHWRAH